jgi:hypothetical protein
LLYKKKGKDQENFNPDIVIDHDFLDGEILDDAGVVVPLLGNEISPEMLVEIGAALNTKEKLQVANIVEVPNQTFLEAVVDDNPKVTALARRFSRLAKSNQINIDFESIVTHNISNTISELSDQTHCDWLVFSWNGRARTGILVNNPIGWLMTNINSNFALFKDNGVRYIGKVLIALRPGRNDKKFIDVADRVSQFYGASFSLLRVVPEDISVDRHNEIEKTSKKLISNSVAESNLVVVKSNNAIETISKASASYDLLIVGTPQKDSWVNVLFGTGTDKFTEKSACSVLRLTVKNA